MSSLFIGARHAQYYRRYRPSYPPEVYTAIIDYCRKGFKDFNVAVDLGCGTGQSTLPLTKHFKQVTGIDPSENQINEANLFQKESNVENVDFAIGSAENLSRFGASSVDLITCAQSYHWLDMKKFYPEAKRILTDEGVLVAYGYGNVVIDSNEGNKLIQEFYSDTLAEYWDSRRRHIDNHLTDFAPFPLADFKRLDSLHISRDMTVDGFIGYLNSWSAYQTYMESHTNTTVLDTLRTGLCKEYNTNEPKEITIKATLPVFMLFGRNQASP